MQPVSCPDMDANASNAIVDAALQVYTLAGKPYHGSGKKYRRGCTVRNDKLFAEQFYDIVNRL